MIIYINKIGKRITFKIKTGYYLELLTPKTRKLLGSTENKIAKNKYGENVPRLEITEVALVLQESRALYKFKRICMHSK